MAQNNQGDSSNDAIIVFGAVFIGVIVLFNVFGDNLKAVYLTIQSGWVHAYAFILSYLPFGVPDAITKTQEVIEIYRPKELSGNDMKGIAQVMKLYSFIPLALIFGIYAYRIWRKNPLNSFKRVHSRQSLCNSEVKLWPWISPILTLDLVKEPIDTGKWAMGKTPVDFCKKYKLLNGIELDKKRARKLFAAQLGGLWEGPKKLKPYEKALFAAFIAQACKDKNSATEGLKQLALSISSGKPDYSWVNGLLDKHMNNPIVTDLISKSAYKTTVISFALEAARKNGVLPPAYFVWLRPVNRALWYSLNGVGRRTPFCEVAGIHGHRLAEKVAGKPLRRPYIENSVQALEKALAETKFEN